MIYIFICLFLSTLIMHSDATFFGKGKGGGYGDGGGYGGDECWKIISTLMQNDQIEINQLNT